jgi:hypothetical protein
MKVNKLLETYIERMVESMLMEEDPSMAATPAARPRSRGQASVRQPFNMDQFKAEQGLDQKMRYLQSTLKQIGEGSSRTVFQLDNEFVIKMAKNPAGVGQNKAEATVCTIDKGLELFAKVAEPGQGYEWLKSEFAAPISEEQFQQFTSIPWKTFTLAMFAAFPEKIKSGQASSQSQQALQSLANNQWFKRVLNVMKGCKYEPGDMTKLDSWGTVNGRAVVVDSGFTEAVQQAFYAAPPEPAPGQQ